MHRLQMSVLSMRSNGNRLEWSGVLLPGIIRGDDAVLVHSLACPVEYARLVRRKLDLWNRFTPSWCAKVPRIANRIMAWERAWSDWIWAQAPLRSWRIRWQCSNPSARRWPPTRKRCGGWIEGWIASSIGNAGPTIQATMMSVGA